MTVEIANEIKLKRDSVNWKIYLNNLSIIKSRESIIANTSMLFTFWYCVKFSNCINSFFSQQPTKLDTVLSSFYRWEN